MTPFHSPVSIPRIDALSPLPRIDALSFGSTEHGRLGEHGGSGEGSSAREHGGSVEDVSRRVGRGQCDSSGDFRHQHRPTRRHTRTSQLRPVHAAAARASSLDDAGQRGSSGDIPRHARAWRLLRAPPVTRHERGGSDEVQRRWRARAPSLVRASEATLAISRSVHERGGFGELPQRHGARASGAADRTSAGPTYIETTLRKNAFL